MASAPPFSLLIHHLPGRHAVTAGVWVVHGAAHDPPSRAGATHLLEHLTLRRCGDRDRRSLARMVDRLGGEVDAWTSTEVMGVTGITTRDALGELLDLLVDAIIAPTLDAEDVELERRVALAELELLLDDPTEQVEEALLEAAWGDHPLARPILGSRDSLRRLTPRALARHHTGLIAPGRLLVAVAGDVDPGRVREHVARLPLDAPPAQPPLPPLAWIGGRRSVERAGLEQVHARLAYPAPGAGDPSLPSLAVLERLLGGGTSSRLFQRLREEEGLVYDIWSDLVIRHAGGLLEVGWACSPEVYPTVRRLVSAELAEVVPSVAAEEVETAREGLIRSLRLDAESPGALCSLEVSEMLDHGRRFDLGRSVAELAGVGLEEVRRMASEILRPGSAASAVCGPEGLAEQVA